MPNPPANGNQETGAQSTLRAPHPLRSSPYSLLSLARSLSSLQSPMRSSLPSNPRAHNLLQGPVPVLAPGSDSGSAHNGSNSNPSRSGTTNSGSSGKSSSGSVGVIVGSVIAVVFGVSFVGVLGFYYYNRKQQHFGRVQRPNATVIHPWHSGSNPDTLKITVMGSSTNGGMTVSESHSQTSSGPSDVHVIDAGNVVDSSS